MFRCNICNNTFSRKDALKRHRRIHDNVVNQGEDPKPGVITLSSLENYCEPLNENQVNRIRNAIRNKLGAHAQQSELKINKLETEEEEEKEEEDLGKPTKEDGCYFKRFKWGNSQENQKLFAELSAIKTDVENVRQEIVKYKDFANTEMEGIRQRLMQYENIYKVNQNDVKREEEEEDEAEEEERHSIDLSHPLSCSLNRFENTPYITYSDINDIVDRLIYLHASCNQTAAAKQEIQAIEDELRRQNIIE